MNEPNTITTQSALQQKEQMIRIEQRALRKKLLLMVSAGLMLLVVLVALGIAWYTRVGNVYSITFEVADYDLAVNRNVDDKFLLNVYEYAEVTNKKMAPGTIGWLPLEISTEYSKVDVAYSIFIESQMATTIRKHFRFFVLKETAATTADSEKIETYHYGDAVAQDQLSKYDLEVLNSPDDVIQGSMKAGSKETLCIYWEWYLDAEDAGKKGEKFGADASAKDWSALTEEEKKSNSSAWDELDTDIGRYPQKYADAMEFYLYTSGTQIKPNAGKVPTPTPTPTGAPGS